MKTLSKHDNDPDNKRGVDGENEATNLLAQHGYEYT